MLSSSIRSVIRPAINTTRRNMSSAAFDRPHTEIVSNLDLISPKTNFGEYCTGRVKLILGVVGGYFAIRMALLHLSDPERAGANGVLKSHSEE